MPEGRSIDRRRPSSVAGLGVALVVVAVLYLAKPVLLPLAVAILLSAVISPIVKRLERLGVGRLRIGRIGSVAAVTFAIAGAFSGIGWILGVQGEALVEKLPAYRRVVFAQLREPLDSLRRLERTASQVRELTQPPGGDPPPPQVEVVDGDSELIGFARDWVGSVVSLLGTAGLVLVLLVFLLIEREALRDRVLRIAAPDDLRVTTSALGDAVERVTAYVRALALLNLGHGTLIALGLWLIGLPGALLLGLLSAVLRFVPYLGPWLAASLALISALVSSEGWTVPVTVAVFLVCVELVSNNVLEPWLFGASVGVSPFALILSAIFWAWLWGPLGLVLATPLTATLIAFGRYVPHLEPFAILLSDAEALSPAERLYQRLLAHDAYEAAALVAERTTSLGGALAAWDEVVMPALGLLERDRREGRFDSEQLDIALETFELLLSELPEAAPVTATPLVLCIPARGGWDETVCAALVRFLSARGVVALALRHKLSTELAEEVAQAAVEQICVSSLGSLAGGPQHLLLRIRKRCPETTVVLGHWGQGADSTLQPCKADPRTFVVSRLSEATDRVRGAIPT